LATEAHSDSFEFICAIQITLKLRPYGAIQMCILLLLLLLLLCMCKCPVDAEGLLSQGEHARRQIRVLPPTFSICNYFSALILFSSPPGRVLWCCRRAYVLRTIFYFLRLNCCPSQSHLTTGAQISTRIVVLSPSMKKNFFWLKYDEVRSRDVAIATNFVAVQDRDMVKY